MAIPVNTLVEWRGTTKTVEANGAACANNALVAADDATYSVATDGEGCPDAEIILALTFGVAPTDGTSVMVYARQMDTGGSGNHSKVPETTSPGFVCGGVQVDNVATAQYLRLVAYNLPPVVTFYLHNAGTGQTLSAGWTMTVTPLTRTPKV